MHSEIKEEIDVKTELFPKAQLEIAIRLDRTSLIFFFNKIEGNIVKRTGIS